MNRMYLWGIAMGVAILGIALLGNETRAVAGDCCAPACCASACDTCAPCHVPCQAVPVPSPRSDLLSEHLRAEGLLCSGRLL